MFRLNFLLLLLEDFRSTREVGEIMWNLALACHRGSSPRQYSACRRKILSGLFRENVSFNFNANYSKNITERFDKLHKFRQHRALVPLLLLLPFWATAPPVYSLGLVLYRAPVLLLGKLCFINKRRVQLNTVLLFLLDRPSVLHFNLHFHENTKFPSSILQPQLIATLFGDL